MQKNRLLTVALDASDSLVAAIDRLSLSPRQKLAGAVAGVFLTAVVGALATVDGSSASVNAHAVVEKLAVEPVVLGDPTDASFWYQESFNRGDTFGTLLARLQVSNIDAARVVGNAGVSRLLRKLRPGTSVRAEVSRVGELQQMEFITADDRLARIVLADGKLSTSEKALQLTREVVARSTVVRSRLLADVQGAGVPATVAQQISQAFSGSIDVSSTLVRGDRVAALYEVFYFEGQLVRAGRLLAAEVSHAGQTHRALWFDGGNVRGYYNPQGQSMQVGLRRVPLDFARVNSGYGSRLDASGQQWVAHKGIDFGAPIGTPVRATGDGVVDFAGWQNGYGNVVVIRHPGDYTTLYAHLSQFSSGSRTGLRIGQGDTIGFVGQTGWATGPHLHYELRHHGAYMNPLSAALPSGLDLPARQQAQVQVQAKALFAQLDAARQSTAVALVD